MNKRGKITILIVVIIVLLVTVMYAFNFKFADSENVYVIESDASSLKLGDEFTVTLVVECNTILNSLQGRIELSDDIELVDGENSCQFTDFAYEYNNGLSGSMAPELTVSDSGKIIAFSMMGNSDYATGEKAFLTLNLKVKSSTQSSVEIKWRDRKKSGFYDITSISIPRSDVNSTDGTSPSNEETDEGSSNGDSSSGNNSSDSSSNNSDNSSNSNSSSGGTSSSSNSGTSTFSDGSSGTGDSTSSSGYSGNSTSSAGTSGSGQISTSQQDSSTIGGTNSSEDGQTTIAQAGENYNIIILIVLVLICAIIVRIKYKKSEV